MGNALRRDLFCQKHISLVLVQFKASFIQMCVITPVLDKCGGSRWAQSHRAALLTIGFQLLSALQHRVMWNRLAQLWMCYWSYLYCPAFLRAVQSTGKSVVVEEQCRSTSHREKFNLYVCRQALGCWWHFQSFGYLHRSLSGNCAVAGMVCNRKANTECVHLMGSDMSGLGGCFAMWTAVVRQRNVKLN